MSRQKRYSGFSLVELLITVAILAIIFGIAIPYYMSTRSSAQAASAVADLKTIHSAQLSYYTGAGTGAYGTFTQLEGQKLLPSGFSSADLTYTRFEYTGTLALASSNTEFTVTSSPSTISANTPSYFLDEGGAIRYNESGNATASSTPVGQ